MRAGDGARVYADHFDAVAVAEVRKECAITAADIENAADGAIREADDALDGWPGAKEVVDFEEVSVDSGEFGRGEVRGVDQFGLG